MHSDVRVASSIVATTVKHMQCTTPLLVHCKVPIPMLLLCSQSTMHQASCCLQVLAALRLELFRTLLLQKVEFFDRHNTTELTTVRAVEIEHVRSFVFGNVSRDRGLRAILEASGSVLVLFILSWRLGPVLGLVIISTAVTAALYRQQTKEAEKQNSKALSHMVGIADQAFAAIRTVRQAQCMVMSSDAFQHCMHGSESVVCYDMHDEIHQVMPFQGSLMRTLLWPQQHHQALLFRTCMMAWMRDGLSKFLDVNNALCSAVKWSLVVFHKMLFMVH